MVCFVLLFHTGLYDYITCKTGIQTMYSMRFETANFSFNYTYTYSLRSTYLRSKLTKLLPWPDLIFLCQDPVLSEG